MVLSLFPSLLVHLHPVFLWTLQKAEPKTGNPMEGKYLESGSQEARVKMGKKDRKEWKANQVYVIDLVTSGVQSCDEPWECTSELSPENVVPGAFIHQLLLLISMSLTGWRLPPGNLCSPALLSFPVSRRGRAPWIWSKHWKSWIFVCLRCKSISIHGGMSTTAAAEVR